MLTLEISDYIQVSILAAILAQGGIALFALSRQRKIENARATLNAIHMLAELANEKSEPVYSLYGQGGFDFKKSTKAQQIQLTDYLGILEDIAVGVNLGVYDIYIVNRVMGTQVINARKKFNYYIEGIRREQNSASFFVDLELLAYKLECLRRIEPVEGEVENDRNKFLLEMKRRGMRLNSSEINRLLGSK